MIKRWGVKNFKSILEADLELAPLTVFTGVNSSGKSAFLHSIVMMVQAARSNDSDGLINIKNGLIDLGDFGRIYNNKASENGLIGINLTILMGKNVDARLELELKDDEKNEYLRVSHGFLECNKEGKEFSITWSDKRLTDNASELFEEIWRKSIKAGSIQADKIEVNSYYLDCKGSFLPNALWYEPYNHPLSFKEEFLGNDQPLDSIRRFTELLADIPTEKLTKENAKEFANNKFKEKFISFDKYRSEYDLRKQLFYLCANNMWWIDFDANENIIIDSDDKRVVLFEKLPSFGGNSGLFTNFKDNHGRGSEYYKIEPSDWYQVLSNCSKEKREAIQKELKDETDTGFMKSLLKNIQNFKMESHDLYLPDQVESAREFLYCYLNHHIIYLGPLREDPAWCYEAKENNSKQEIIDVGIKGDKTPLVINNLHNNQFEIKNYYSPDFCNDPNYKLENKPKSFTEALTEWLNYIGLADKFKKNEDILIKGKQYSVNMVIDGMVYALPQLGTGVSQVLPILVMCLAAPVGSTLIIEQPELHLHPKMQSRLADFFIAMALSGRQCLIETHSEHFIETLRYRIAGEKNERVKSTTKVYFAEKKDGKTEFEEIEINEYGAIMNWPDDFFDESSKRADDLYKVASEKWEKNKKGQ